MQIPTNKLRYVLDCPGYGSQEATPLGESSFAMSYTLNNSDTSPRYSYDIEFNGALIFNGADFNFLYGAETGGFRCADMTVQLLSDGCGEGWEELLEGTKIKLSDGKWDLDQCTVTIPVISPAPYEALDEKKVDKLDMFTLFSPEGVKMYDYVPQFQFSYMPFDSGGGAGFDLSAQEFAHYPNKRAQYPGFSVEGEKSDPYWPESDTKVFNTNDLKQLTRNPVTFEEILSTGSIPMHFDYPTYSGAFDAIAAGWRLYYFRYKIFNNTTMGSAMGYEARYRWVREIIYVPTGTPMASDWIYAGASGGDDIYVRPPILMPRTNIYKPAYTSETFLNENLVFFEQTTYIVGATTNIINPYDNNDDAHAGTSNGNVFGFEDLPNGRLLNDVIVQSIAHCDPGLTVKSEFFQINPDVVTGTNYVTGQPSFVDKIVMFQKSDVKRPWATEHATVGNYTTDELLNWLYFMFKVKYMIAGNVFRLEHISSDYFRKPATINLTAPPLNRMLAGTRVYTYESKALPSKETFSFMEGRIQVSFGPEDDFVGTPITYDGSCVNRTDKGNIQDRKVERVTTDILFILINSGGTSTQVQESDTANKYTVYQDAGNGVISDDGFCFVASKIVSGVRYGFRLPGILETVDRINNVLGWAHLHNAFYRHEANAQSGTINAAGVTFYTTKPIRKQMRLPFDMCCVAGFDPHEQIVSALGTGVVKTAEWSPQSAVMRVELLFPL